jgi:APA family basic amino acid/polyamine antiporter
VIIGNTIGAGIFRTPGTIAEHLPNVWLFLGVWVVGGIYALLGSISYAELGAMIPRSGGQYVFARHAIGEYAGFLVGWRDWLSTVGSTAAVALVIGSFAGSLFPRLNSSIAMVGVASAGNSFFGLLQWRGIAMGSTAQNITSLLKALAFVVLIAAAFMFGVAAPFPNRKHKPDWSVGPRLLLLCCRCRRPSTRMTGGMGSSISPKKLRTRVSTFLAQ